MQIVLNIVPQLVVHHVLLYAGRHGQPSTLLCTSLTEFILFVVLLFLRYLSIFTSHNYKG